MPKQAWGVSEAWRLEGQEEIMLFLSGLRWQNESNSWRAYAAR